jgi:sulfite exporter TauE/SafE
VNFALLLSALLMGLAGSVHCVAMCSGPSAAAVAACGSGRPAGAWAGFHLGRLLGYTVAGAVVASSVSALAWLGAWTPALRPLWTLAHLAALALGLWLLWQGRQPEWLESLGRQTPRASGQGGWQRMNGPTRATAVGAVWWAWPCGLLQSALMVAALANGPWGGAAVMAVFALASSIALGLAPALWLRLGGRGRQLDARIVSLAVRVSGAALAGASAWALGHGLWVKLIDYCLS